jgi:hypothetical protein
VITQVVWDCFFLKCLCNVTIVIQHLIDEVESVIIICVKDSSFFAFQDFKKVLQKNVVAYISLHSPIRGNSSLQPVASPSLQQLVVEVRFPLLRKMIIEDCLLLYHLALLDFFPFKYAKNYQ